MKKVNGVNHPMQLKVVSRRKNVIARLENQLKIGRKPLFWFNEQLSKIVQSPVETVELTETDINRIKKEIEVLKTRIKN